MIFETQTVSLSFYLSAGVFTLCIVHCISEMTVELIEGDQASFNGPVRVTVNGLSGRVCANNWTDAAADVVCRQLGATGGKAYQLNRLVRDSKGPFTWYISDSVKK